MFQQPTYQYISPTSASCLVIPRQTTS
uniref:Uncharacterized protein n=1 Tax=Moniliophthora roreri TaxID=221103 RepID=A0A0W0G9F4_MONRR